MAEEQLTALEDLDLYEISLVQQGMNLEDGFLIKKSKQNDEAGDKVVTDEKDKFDVSKVELSELSDEDKEKLLSKLRDEFETDKQIEIFLDGDEIAEAIQEKFGTEKEDEEEVGKETSMAPASRELLKTVLDKLSKVQNDIPANYQWVYSAIAELVDETTPEFAKSAKVAELDLSEDTRETIEKTLDQFNEAKELSTVEKSIKDALEGLVMKEKQDEIENKVSKEVQNIRKEYKQKVEKLKRENQELREKELKKQLEAKASQLENLPIKQSELTELMAKLYKADEDVFDEVENLLKKINTESAVGELFKEKGTARRDKTKDEPETAQDKIDQLVKEIVEKEDIEKSKAMQKVLENDPKLYEEYREEKSG